MIARRVPVRRRLVALVLLLALDVLIGNPGGCGCDALRQRQAVTR